MIRLLVTGSQGQVARSLQAASAVRGDVAVTALGRPQIDFEVPAGVEEAIVAARPDIVVNAAAYTAVDKAESEEDRAHTVNRDGAAAAARAAERLRVPFIHLSTDYVYPGDKPTPYVESDATGPLGAYGRSKLAGEVAVRAACPGALILRTAWVYSPYGQNFVRTMLRVGAERPVLRVVDDQIGNPTAAPDIADAILRITPQVVAGTGYAATLHLAGSGYVTWYGFACRIFETSAALGGPNPRVEPIATAQYPTPARRPANSRLDTSAFAATFGFRLKPWQEAVDETVRILLAPGN